MQQHGHLVQFTSERSDVKVTDVNSFSGSICRRFPAFGRPALVQTDPTVWRTVSLVGQIKQRAAGSRSNRPRASSIRRESRSSLYRRRTRRPARTPRRRSLPAEQTAAGARPLSEPGPVRRPPPTRAWHRSCTPVSAAAIGMSRSVTPAPVESGERPPCSRIGRGTSTSSGTGRTPNDRPGVTPRGRNPDIGRQKNTTEREQKASHRGEISASKVTRFVRSQTRSLHIFTVH